MVLANTEWLDWESQPCFAHTLQLATNDGFKLQHINYVVASASCINSHFHHRTTVTQALKQKHQLQNLPAHKLVQYCRTRWNSIHDMFERLQEQRWTISSVLSDRAFTKVSDAWTLELTDDSWGVMEELLPVLHSLKCATTALCRESGVSISMFTQWQQPFCQNISKKSQDSLPKSLSLSKQCLRHWSGDLHLQMSAALARLHTLHPSWILDTNTWGSQLRKLNALCRPRCVISSRTAQRARKR